MPEGFLLPGIMASDKNILHQQHRSDIQCMANRPNAPATGQAREYSIRQHMINFCSDVVIFSMIMTPFDGMNGSQVNGTNLSFIWVFLGNNAIIQQSAYCVNRFFEKITEINFIPLVPWKETFFWRKKVSPSKIR